MNNQHYPFLSRIESPADLRGLEEESLPDVADDLRRYLIESVATSGGHFGAGLGCVELTVALHYLYETPYDRIVWDVGHQAYAHKMFTGRRKQFTGLRQHKGISGFPKRSESPHDAFGVAGSQKAIDFADEGYPQAGVVPYGCVWTARGVLLPGDDPRIYGRAGVEFTF